MESAAAIAGQTTRPHLVVSVAEHKAVIDPAKWLKRRGFDVTFVDVDQYGMVQPEAVARAIRDSTVLVSVMLANNEVGTINPVDAIGQECHQRDVLFHCDATQGTACLPIDFANWPVDLISVSAHKAYGPKGVGALFVKREVRRRIQPLFHGGGHEQSLRSGTLPVPLIVGFGAACQLADPEPSHVLKAMGRSDELAIASLRFGLGRGNSVEDVDFTIDYISQIVGLLNEST
ncbi:UNVERIFIED_CONTAM: hypothetical protein GTU68_013973 [Idotea baltica]|nr:hypothetical protein [Idotea baltica]